MTPTQIEGMIDRICGLFPTSQIGRNTVKNAWTADDFLLFQTVEDARNIMPIIMDNHEKFPSLKEVHRAFRLLRKPAIEQTVITCEICEGSGWDSGERWNFQTKELLCERNTRVSNEMIYTYVVRCKCWEFTAA